MRGREEDEDVPSIAVPLAGCEEEGLLWGRQQEEAGLRDMA